MRNVRPGIAGTAGKIVFFPGLRKPPRSGSGWRCRGGLPSSFRMPPAFVFFDLGNVLFSFDRERAFRQMAAACGGTVDAVRAAVMEHGLHEALETGRIDWGGFHADFSRLTDTASDSQTLAHAASDMFTLNVGMLPVIAAVERAGCRTGILSNTSAIHWRHLAGGDYAILPGRFTHNVLSYEVGAMKPEPAIYAAAAARAETPPEKIFFCDDLPVHVEAARAAGWDAEPFTSASGIIAALARRGLNLGL
jgi:FMN phosphatase YigB (HAD superfamily)